MSRTVWLAVPPLLIAPLFARGEEPPKKPACTAHIRGKLWPQKTARGADVPVEMCAPKGFHYAWQQLTINVAQLRAATKPKETAATVPVSDPAPERRE